MKRLLMLAFSLILGFSKCLYAGELSPLPVAGDKETAPAIQEISRQLDERLLEIVKLGDGPKIRFALYKLMATPEFAWADFIVLEGRLRMLKTDIYLVAAPLRFAEGNVRSES